MTENTAPNTAENQRTVDLRNDDQEDHRADCTTPADDLDTEDRDAAIADLPAYRDSTAVVSAPLSSIFGSALPPLLDDDSLGCY